jgi:predicted MFS family arabinose efflux permease
LLAAGAWLMAATARVTTPKQFGNAYGITITDAVGGPSQAIVDGVDIGRTLSLQSKWNTAAAAFACAAAIFQATLAWFAT